MLIAFWPAPCAGNSKQIWRYWDPGCVEFSQTPHSKNETSFVFPAGFTLTAFEVGISVVLNPLIRWFSEDGEYFWMTYRSWFFFNESPISVVWIRFSCFSDILTQWHQSCSWFFDEFTLSKYYELLSLTWTRKKLFFFFKHKWRCCVETVAIHYKRYSQWLSASKIWLSSGEAWVTVNVMTDLLRRHFYEQLMKVEWNEAEHTPLYLPSYFHKHCFYDYCRQSQPRVSQ